MNRRVLLVDDERNLLLGLHRHLRKQFDIETAVGGAAALELIKASEPFAVIVSDMQMPEMSGLELLATVRGINENTVRIMLTGNADQKTAVDAINEGSIFRFLCKPCQPDELAKTLEAGIEQYRLITAEAELLSKTLAGSVRVLTQTLSLAMPEAFGQTQEARALVKEIGKRLEVKPMWQLELAAMLMRIGCVSLPPAVLHRYLNGEQLPVGGDALIQETPRIAADLIGAIPRLKPVANLIALQLVPPSRRVPVASRILKVVGDFQRLRGSQTPQDVLRKLEDAEQYDQSAVAILHELVDQMYESREVSVMELAEGMVLETNVEDGVGRLLMAAGIEIHTGLIEKLRMLNSSGVGVREPIRVRILNLENPLTASSAA